MLDARRIRLWRAPVRTPDLVEADQLGLLFVLVPVTGDDPRNAVDDCVGRSWSLITTSPTYLGLPELLFVVLRLLAQVVVLHTVRHGLALQKLGNLSKVLRVQQELLFEYFLLCIGPHVDELSLVVDPQRILDESVGVDESSSASFRRKQ